MRADKPDIPYLLMLKEMIDKSADEDTEGAIELARRIIDSHKDVAYPVAYALAQQVFRGRQHVVKLKTEAKQLRAALREALDWLDAWVASELDGVDDSRVTKLAELRKLCQP